MDLIYNIKQALREGSNRRKVINHMNMYDSKTIALANGRDAKSNQIVLYQWNYLHLIYF